MNETDNQEFEIDLLELLKEFKNNIAKIFGVTFLFAAAAALFVFVLTAPKYSYSQYIDCSTLNDRDKISFVNIFNEDAISIKGHGKMWKERKKCALFKVEL
jgi:LPS O-antigen subunit length determinant protein (WzzB/FepE family)